MNREIKISKVVLTVGKKEMELTPEEVRDLKLALEKMYPEPTKEIVYRDNWWLTPWYPPAQPIYPTITYSSSSVVDDFLSEVIHL